MSLAELLCKLIVQINLLDNSIFQVFFFVIANIKEMNVTNANHTNTGKNLHDTITNYAIIF